MGSLCLLLSWCCICLWGMYNLLTTSTLYFIMHREISLCSTICNFFFFFVLVSSIYSFFSVKTCSSKSCFPLLFMYSIRQSRHTFFMYFSFLLFFLFFCSLLKMLSEVSLFSVAISIWQEDDYYTYPAFKIQICLLKAVAVAFLVKYGSVYYLSTVFSRKKYLIAL